jgi:type IV pilus assembly protein PilA
MPIRAPKAMARTVISRTDAEDGFTLIEMLIVVIILSILVAIAVPAYLLFRDRADDVAAKSNLRAMIPAVEAFMADNGANGYTGMTIGGAGGLKSSYNILLKGWDAGTSTGVTILSAGAATYCIKSVERGITYYKDGPQSEIVQAPACT